MQAKVAVVGGGVAGIVAAYLLQRRYQVDLFEAGSWLGGHTHTVVLEAGADAGTAIDTGFIVFNGETYPLFQKFLQELGVTWRLSDMSFGYYCEASGWAYGGHDLATFFARWRNLCSPDFLRFSLELLHFNRRALHDLEAQRLQGSLRNYLRGYSRALSRHYIAPLGAAIWSAPLDSILDFPVETFVRFFANHGLLRVVDRPDWFTVEGGSFRYVQAFEKSFQGSVFLSTPVEQVSRQGESVLLRVAGQELLYDRVVLATHADQALGLLTDPSAQEQEALGSWRYLANQVVLHSDVSVLPPIKKVRASWNYRRPRESQALPTLTYDMNRLQGLRTQRHYLVTLNPQELIDPQCILGQWSVRHPQYDEASVFSQARLPSLQGRRNTAYCGSYHRFGFHEDAVQSGVQAAAALGVDW